MGRSFVTTCTVTKNSLDQYLKGMPNYQLHFNGNKTIKDTDMIFVQHISQTLEAYYEYYDFAVSINRSGMISHCSHTSTDRYVHAHFILYQWVRHGLIYSIYIKNSIMLLQLYSKLSILPHEQSMGRIVNHVL